MNDFIKRQEAIEVIHKFFREKVDYVCGERKEVPFDEIDHILECNKELSSVIKEIPTAYDVEEVVKELEEAKKAANEETFGRRNGKSILFGFVHGINLAIRVVRWNARFGSNPDIKEIAKWVFGSMRKGGVKHE